MCCFFTLSFIWTDECWCFRLPLELWSLLVSHTFITIFSSEILSLHDDVITFTMEAPKAQTGHETLRAAETLYRSFKMFEVQKVLNILEELRYIIHITFKLTEQRTKTRSCYQTCWHPETGTSTYLWPHSLSLVRHKSVRLQSIKITSCLPDDTPADLRSAQSWRLSRLCWLTIGQLHAGGNIQSWTRWCITSCQWL